MDRKKCLFDFLTKELGYQKDDIGEITESGQCDFGQGKLYTCGEAGSWGVYTEEEATKGGLEYIEEALWAFNSDFLAECTGFDEVIFEALSNLCEGANAAVKALIEDSCGIEDFVEKAVDADGFGHFLNTYDGNTHQYGDYYLFRME